ncbi:MULTISPECIES: hypothetical protein [unclassified Modestobacter]
MAPDDSIGDARATAAPASGVDTPAPVAQRRSTEDENPAEGLAAVRVASSGAPDEDAGVAVDGWPEYVPEYRIVPVDRLPRPRPFRTDCMGPRPAVPRRRWWQWWSRQLPAAPTPRLVNCCWYHCGDWSLACDFAVTEVRRALASGATGWTVRDRVMAAVRESVTDPWQLQAIESLIDPATAIVIDEPSNAYVNGQHRAFAMRDQGVTETVVL